MGDKYGYRPIPSEIPATEFNTIVNHLAGHPELQVMNDWYKLDENAKVPTYILQVNTHIFATMYIITIIYYIASSSTLKSSTTFSL